MRGEAESLATSTVVASISSSADAAVAKHLRALVTAARANASASRSSTRRSRARRPSSGPIDPYGIVHHAGEWYVVGHCHKRGDVAHVPDRSHRRRYARSASASSRPPTSTSRRTGASGSTCRRPTRSPCASQLDALAVTRIGVNWPVGEVTMQRRWLGRAPRRLRRLRVGHSWVSASAVTPGSSDRTRRGRRCASGSPSCARTSLRRDGGADLDREVDRLLTRRVARGERRLHRVLCDGYSAPSANVTSMVPPPAIFETFALSLPSPIS